MGILDDRKMGFEEKFRREEELAFRLTALQIAPSRGEASEAATVSTA